MDDIKRIMMECRYLLSLDKTYKELAKIVKVDEKTIYHDLNVTLKEYDTALYQKVNKKMQKIL